MKPVVQLIATATLALAGGAGIAAAATIYKWTDKDGTVHFSERPPEHVNAIPVSGRNLSTVPVVVPPVPAPDQPGQEGVPEGEEPPKSTAQKRREERAKKREEMLNAQQELEMKCQAMRQQLAWVEPNPRVIVQDPDGTTRRLDDEERVRLVEEARTFIEQNCE